MLSCSPGFGAGGAAPCREWDARREWLSRPATHRCRLHGAAPDTSVRYHPTGVRTIVPGHGRGLMHMVKAERTVLARRPGSDAEAEGPRHRDPKEAS